jgi:hypothetical protein
MFKTYLPIHWKGHLPINDFGVIVVLDVEFFSNFGPFYTLDKVAVLKIDFCEGIVTEIDEKTGKKLRQCEYFAMITRRSDSRRAPDRAGGRRRADKTT